MDSLCFYDSICNEHVVYLYGYRITGECAHVLAVVLKLTDWILDGLTEVPSQPSCTSLPSRWEKPRGMKIKAEPVSSMVLSRPTNVTRKRRPITSVFVDNRLVKTKVLFKNFIVV